MSSDSNLTPETTYSYTVKAHFEAANKEILNNE